VFLRLKKILELLWTKLRCKSRRLNLLDESKSDADVREMSWWKIFFDWGVRPRVCWIGIRWRRGRESMGGTRTTRGMGTIGGTRTARGMGTIRGTRTARGMGMIRGTRTTRRTRITRRRVRTTRRGLREMGMGLGGMRRRWTAARIRRPIQGRRMAWTRTSGHLRRILTSMKPLARSFILYKMRLTGVG
jgi:hypothetical protein